VNRYFVASSRVVHAVFFLFTVVYCLLTYNPFAYQQFIKPHLVSGLSGFVAWHHLGFWVVLGLVALTMLRELASQSIKGRLLGTIYLLVLAAIGVVLLVRPVLPQVDNDARGLVLAAIALLPIIWLALYDHRVVAHDFKPLPASEARVAGAFLMAALFVWSAQTLGAPWRLGETGEIRLAPVWVVFGALTSAAGHLFVFTLFLSVTCLAFRAGSAAGLGGPGQYWILVTLSATATTLVVKTLVFGAISFGGPAAWLIAALAGVSFALFWSAVALRLGSDRHPEADAMDAWLSALPGRSPRAAGLGALGTIAAGSWAMSAVRTFDWDFLGQRLVVLAVWVGLFGYSFRLLRATTGGSKSWPWLVAPASLALALVPASVLVEPQLSRWLRDPAFVSEFALDGYVAVDPSFRVIRHMLRSESVDDRVFYDFLKRNTGLRDETLKPPDVDFVLPLRRAGGPRPHIFLLVVDSLRWDYVSAHNPKVRFTPSIERLAADSLVFERAFTRYGGTGLSMAALWTGGMVVHKQYVTPYSPMNALEKLLDAEGYRRAISLDHITRQIARVEPPPAGFVELDRGRAEMRYDLCATLKELSRAIDAGAAEAGPLFAHTRSLNLHIAHVRRTPVPPGGSYDGFYGPVAATVERLDGCIGAFVDDLKRQGLYDQSIIVLTSDHGDTLGESLRWGHSYTLFPHVVRVPLLVHIPSNLAARFEADERSVAFSTDITPTLYALLGHAPIDRGTLFGSSLVSPRGTAPRDRGRDAFLLASSYGPVYAVLRDDANYLYIADGVNGVDYAYDISDHVSERIGISAANRARDRAFIRQQLVELGRPYGFHAQP
jgi:Sulfatase